MIALVSSFGVLTSLYTSSMGLCITVCYHHAWLWGSLSPLAWPWRNTCSFHPSAAVMLTDFFFLVIGLLLITSSHQVLIPLIEKDPNKAQWLCSCPRKLGGPEFKSQLHSVTWLCDLGQTVDIFGVPLSFYLFIYLFILFLFLAVLGLRFYARAFSSCGERGPLFIAVRGPLTIVASCCGAQAPDAQAQ